MYLFIQIKLLENHFHYDKQCFQNCPILTIEPPSTTGTLSTSADANSNIHKISSSCTQTLPPNQQSPVEPKDLCTETDNDAIRIQAARASRLLPEPDFTTNTDAVVVAVRHIDLGIITRCFRSSETITAVYDWVGSLQAEPVNFVLCNALSPGHGIDPSKAQCVLLQRQCLQ